MATAELSIVPVEPQPFTNRQLDLIKTTIAPGISDEQLELFGMVAQRTGLDPFSRQIYAILRNAKEKDDKGNWRTVKKMTIQTGIDGYRAIAARTNLLAGIDDATYGHETADGYPSWATVTVYRFVQGQRCAFTATARWGEYAVYKDEYEGDKKTGVKVPSDMWQRMPYLMLGKCAEALALRKAFPNEISGVYTAEEMAQADNEPPRYAEHAGRTVDAQTGEVVQPSTASLIVPRPDEVMRQRIADQEAARKATPVDPWAPVRELATALNLPDAVRQEISKRNKKDPTRILAELQRIQTERERERDAQPAADGITDEVDEPEPVEPASLKDLDFGQRGN